MSRTLSFCYIIFLHTLHCICTTQAQWNDIAYIVGIISQAKHVSSLQDVRLKALWRRCLLVRGRSAAAYMRVPQPSMAASCASRALTNVRF